MFITTANMLETIPPALRDRLEVIELLGYTLDEKLKIAERYLIPRQIDTNGLKPDQISFTRAALRMIVADKGPGFARVDGPYRPEAATEPNPGRRGSSRQS